MDVTGSESRIKNTFSSASVYGNWRIWPQVVQVRAINRSVLDFFYNIIRTNPSGETMLEMHVKGQHDGLWSREDFRELCEEYDVSGKFQIMDVEEDATIIELVIETTNPHTVTDFVRALPHLPRVSEERREESVEV